MGGGENLRLPWLVGRQFPQWSAGRINRLSGKARSQRWPRRVTCAGWIQTVGLGFRLQRGGHGAQGPSWSAGTIMERRGHRFAGSRKERARPGGTLDLRRGACRNRPRRWVIAGKDRFAALPEGADGRASRPTVGVRPDRKMGKRVGRFPAAESSLEIKGPGDQGFRSWRRGDSEEPNVYSKIRILLQTDRTAL